MTGRQGAWLVQGLESVQLGVAMTMTGSWARREVNRKERSLIAVAVEGRREGGRREEGRGER